MMRRATSVFAAACMMVTALVAASPSHASTTPYPGGIWEPGPAQYGVVATKNVTVPMSDGASLTVDVYYPADLITGARATGPFPVLLTQTPYTGSLGASNLTSSTGPGALFVQHGYIFVSADIRGTGRSGGMGGFFSPRDAQDGVELVQWAAQLDGSNGDVGLQGCSYLGQTQLYTAAKLGANSPVKATIPMCIGGDVYRDIYFDNGIPTPAWTGATCCAGSLLGPTEETFLLPKLAETQTGGDVAFYKQFWFDRDHVAQAQATVDAGIPALMWNGWIDNGFGGLELYAALQNAYFGRDPYAPLRPGDPVTGRYQMIVGEWDHGGGIDPAIELEWYDTWIKHVATGMNVNTSTPLHVWERQRGWVNTAAYPMTNTYTKLFLGSGGTLGATSPSSAGSDALSWGLPVVAGNAVSYTSAPFASGTSIGGPGSVNVTVSTTGSNFELMADLFDVAPDGTATHVTHGGLLGSLAARDATRSWTDSFGLSTRPFLSLQTDTPVTPNTPAQYAIPLQPAVWSIAPGHSIRLQLATQPDLSNCLSNMAAIEAPAVGCFPRAPQLAELMPTTTTIALGGAQPSSINLPLLAFGTFPLTNHGTTPSSGGQDLPLDW